MHQISGPTWDGGFSTRPDGNLNFWDWPLDRFSQEWPRLSGMLSGKEFFPRFNSQIHGNTILEVVESSPAGLLGAGDALITRVPGVPIGVFTADCLPILLAGKTSVSAIHAGWKGTRLGIAGKTVTALRERFEEQPSGIQAWLGPCIGSCCLELGEEVPPTFWEIDPVSQAAFSRGRKWHLDLRALNVLQLIRAGVAPEHIRHVSDCTKCFPEEYFSYRGQKGRQGSMFSFILRKP